VVLAQRFIAAASRVAKKDPPYERGIITEWRMKHFGHTPSMLFISSDPLSTSIIRTIPVHRNHSHRLETTNEDGVGSTLVRSGHVRTLCPVSRHVLQGIAFTLEFLALIAAAAPELKTLFARAGGNAPSDTRGCEVAGTLLAHAAERARNRPVTLGASASASTLAPLVVDGHLSGAIATLSV
jgi:hypothetical protein